MRIMVINTTGKDLSKEEIEKIQEALTNVTSYIDKKVETLERLCDEFLNSQDLQELMATEVHRKNPDEFKQMLRVFFIQGALAEAMTTSVARHQLDTLRMVPVDELPQA